MIEIVICTNNTHKVAEFKAMFSPYKIKISSLKDYNINLSVEENGLTYIDNALIKVRFFERLLPDKYLLSDDSGLEINALPNILGIHSARFMENHSYEVKNNYIYELIKDKEDKNAKFTCALVLLTPLKEEIIVSAEVKRVIRKPNGTSGFGYDPLFIDEAGRSFGNIKGDEKNKISHRGKAVEKLIKILQERGII